MGFSPQSSYGLPWWRPRPTGVSRRRLAAAVLLLVGGGLMPRSGAAAPATEPGACGPTLACPADHFCARSGRCVSAVVSVVAGAQHSCAVHRNGRISCWGFADAVKGTSGAVSGPVEISGVDHPRALSGGYQETCAVTREAQVRCFGLDDFLVRAEGGQPMTGVTAVALGAGFGCALAAAGTYCWGRNESGQLARPLATAGSPNALLAVPGPRRFLGAGLAVITHDGRIAPGQVCGWGNNATHLVPGDRAAAAGVVATPVCARLDDVAELVVGAAHACARHARGSFSCWGERYYGQLGDGASKDRADVPAPGQMVGLSAPALQIAAGAGHTCVLVKGGQVFCFGLNSAGQVGEGPDQVYRPRLRTGLHGKVVAIGSGSAARHTCAVLADGRVECWGNDNAGQLGAAPKLLQEGRLSRRPVEVAF